MATVEETHDWLIPPTQKVGNAECVCPGAK